MRMLAGGKLRANEAEEAEEEEEEGEEEDEEVSKRIEPNTRTAQLEAPARARRAHERKPKREIKAALARKQ